MGPGAADRAESVMAAARDDVRRRLGVAAAFYDRPSIRGYGRAELAFMRWQASRGVFAPLGSARAGQCLVAGGQRRAPAGCSVPGRANLYLSMRNVLPDRYPLTGITIGEILAAENRVGRLIDYGVLLPRAQALYEFAAEELGEPALLGFIRDGNLCYAWPYEERAAWVATRYVFATRLVTRATS